MSVTADTAPEQVVEMLREPLLSLAQRLRDAIAQL
jgi:hypothetical protein